MTRLVILALFLVTCASPSVPAPTCAASGGKDGAEAQLRFVDARDGQIVFTFGPSPVSDTFGVPAFRLEKAAKKDGVALRLSFRGASMRYPDGTTSYNGPLRLDVNGKDVRDVMLAGDAERTLSWMVHLAGECPVVSTKEYVYGKSPRAQLALRFGGMSSFTLETTSDHIGAPQDTPVQAVGMGFGPRTTITITADDTKLWDTTSDADGTFDTGFNIGYLPIGPQRVVASDGKGHRGETTLTVIGR